LRNGSIAAGTYQQFRAKLLDFCMRDYLAPERMAEVRLRFSAKEAIRPVATMIPVNII